MEPKFPQFYDAYSDYYSTGSEGEISDSDSSYDYSSRDSGGSMLKAEVEADEILDQIENHLASRHPNSENAHAYILELFQTADENSDGVLEKHEMAKAFEIMQFPLNPRQLDIVMCMLDHDLSGELDCEEFATILLNHYRFKSGMDKVSMQLKFCRGIQESMETIKERRTRKKQIEP